MLEIKPIQNKLEQESVCVRCGIKYDAAAMAYGASVDGELAGVCQFTLLGDEINREDKNSSDNPVYGIIRGLGYAAGTCDKEALILTARATLNFLDLCKAEYAVCETDLPNEALLQEIGFIRDDKTGKYCVNLKGFFESPCKNNEKK